ncbi:Uncharacterised protein [Vibrio cholerae]|nr:Uncharacterised protein [Vibrio cholerae]CSD47088.1 Uncharacterised protein [Vibrio cholerae]
MQLPKSTDQIRCNLITYGVTRTDAQFAGKHLLLCKQTVDIFGALQQFIGHWQQFLPFLIEHQTVVDAIKQCVTKLFFQL